MKFALFSHFRDFIYPPECFTCGCLLDDGNERVCARCWQGLEEVSPDAPAWHEIREKLKQGGVVRDVFSCYLYEKEGLVQQLVQLLKYGGMKSLGVRLGREIGRRMLREPLFSSADILVPVPLHRSKQRERGFNQSEFICRGISQVLGCSVLNGLVKRGKNNVSQTHLTALERTSNVGDAFEIPEKMRKLVDGKTFIVVDDVITTGSTIRAAARVLKEEGAARVIAASAGLAKLH